MPTDAPAAPLGGTVSALEAELADLGHDIASNHYMQATENHIQHNFEASNSQLRTMTEYLLVRLAQQHCNYSGPPKGGMALNHMIAHGHLPADGEGKLIQGLWKVPHTNGSHPGRSNADEARFRLQTVTAVAASDRPFQDGLATATVSIPLEHNNNSRLTKDSMTLAQHETRQMLASMG